MRTSLSTALAGFLCLIALQTPCSGARAASESEDTTRVPLADVPPAVMAAASCDGAGSESAWRRVFDGRFLFGIKCPSNNQNWNESIVSADDTSGSGAAQVLFPVSHRGGGPTSELSNIRIFPATRTSGEISVDGEHLPGVPCRIESMFRFEDHVPRLIFQRTSKLCDEASDMAWRIVLDKRTPAERRENWN